MFRRQFSSITATTTRAVPSPLYRPVTAYTDGGRACNGIARSERRARNGQLFGGALIRVRFVRPRARNHFTDINEISRTI